MTYCSFGLLPSVICINCQKNWNNHQFEDEYQEWIEPPVKNDECSERIEKDER